MNLDKIFIKKFVNKETTTPFTMKFWDGEEVKIGDGSSKFKVNLYEPLNKKDFLNSASLALGEAYMNKYGDFPLYLTGDYRAENKACILTVNVSCESMLSEVCFSCTEALLL